MKNISKQILQIYIDNGVDFTMESEYKEEKETTVDSCRNLTELRQAVENFDDCDLKKYAKNTVFADGNQKAEVMLIGEAPGEQEDLNGVPFCGRSGTLLDKMLAAINLDRTKVYITNIVFWRPPGNRQPTTQEIELCKPFVEKHISLINPKIIVLVGGIAASTMLNSSLGVSKLRGQFYEYTNKYLRKTITTTAIFHPAYLLRQPKQKKLAWEDLQEIQKTL